MSGSPLVVIPGGTGFAGGRIAEHLAREGWRVRVVSRSLSAWPASPSDNIEVVRLDRGVDQARIDSVGGAKAVVMLAAADEAQSRLDPTRAVRATSEECMAWLDACHRASVQTFVYFSTIHVYGKPSGEVLVEETPTRPTHPYATTHLAAELFVQAAHRAGGTRGIIFRLSNSFGAPVWTGIHRWELLLNDLARQAVLTGQLVLKSDGRQARDFIPLSDVCAAVAWALDRDSSSEEAELYNLGSGRLTTILDMAGRLVDRCERVLGHRPTITRPGDRPQGPDTPFQFGIERLIRAGFEPQADWDTEMDGLLAFCRDHATALAAR